VTERQAREETGAQFERSARVGNEVEPELDIAPVVEPRFDVRGFMQFIRQANTPLAGAKPVNGAVARDAQRPVKWLAQCRVERRGLAPDLQECVLDDFFRLVRVAQNSDGGGEESNRRLVVELRQRLPISRGDAAE